MNDVLMKGNDEKEKSSKGLLIVPVPALVAVLLNKENEKGSALTETEVLEIRDNAVSIAMPVDVKEQIDESRGYTDIDPENVWEEWLVARLELVSGT
jgi:hypothetical protein